MNCRHVPTGHWVGVLTLLFGLCLSVAGVVSPWWRTVDDPHCSTFEGLWQQCSRCWRSRTRCSFSDRHAGLWRAIQAVQLMSLVALFVAALLAITCADKRQCHRGRCPTPAVAAVIGGVAGLMADLMFVGYIERYVPHAPREHMYAWSFAMAVTGALLSLLASLIFSVSKALCSPKFTLQSAEPYWPYNHCSIGVDPSGFPHYVPYRYPYAGVHDDSPIDLNVSAEASAVDKQKLFEQYRHGRVQFLTQEKPPCAAGHSSCSRLAFDYGKEASREPADDKGAVGDHAMVRPPVYHEIHRSVSDLQSTADKSDSSALQAERKPAEKPMDPALSEDAKAGGHSPPQSEGGQRSRPPSPSVVVLTIDVLEKQFRDRCGKGQPPIFTVEKAFRKSCGTEDPKEQPRQPDDEAGHQSSTSSTPADPDQVKE